jgi:hypothetical protein
MLAQAAPLIPTATNAAKIVALRKAREFICLTFSCAMEPARAYPSPTMSPTFPWLKRYRKWRLFPFGFSGKVELPPAASEPKAAILVASEDCNR